MHTRYKLTWVFGIVWRAYCLIAGTVNFRIIMVVRVASKKRDNDYKGDLKHQDKGGKLDSSKTIMRCRHDV